MNSGSVLFVFMRRLKRPDLLLLHPLAGVNNFASHMARLMLSVVVNQTFINSQ